MAANSLYGMSLGGEQYDTHGAVDTQVINNILANNEAFGLSMGYAEGRYANTTVDYNLYYNNGWRPDEQGGIWHARAMVIREGGSWDPYITLTEAQAATPWEDHGLEGDPAFWDYDLADHTLHDGSWPDFHLIAGSTAIDHGTTTLPASLLALLDAYGVEYNSRGAAYDMGRYEAGFTLRSIPATHSIEPGSEAYYTLSLDPSDLPHPVTLSVDALSPDLTATLSASTLDPTGAVTLTVAHHGPATTQWYSISVSASGGGFVSTTNVLLLVNGYQTYMPLVNAAANVER